MTQLALFETPAAPVRRDERDIRWERAFSPAVELDVMAIFSAKPAEWLDWRDFRTVIDKYKISSCFGHVLYYLCRTGKTVDKNIYFGAELPGPNYSGFRSVYMLAGGPTA